MDAIVMEMKMKCNMRELFNNIEYRVQIKTAEEMPSQSDKSQIQQTHSYPRTTTALGMALNK